MSRRGVGRTINWKHLSIGRHRLPMLTIVTLKFILIVSTLKLILVAGKNLSFEVLLSDWRQLLVACEALRMCSAITKTNIDIVCKFYVAIAFILSCKIQSRNIRNNSWYLLIVRAISVQNIAGVLASLETSVLLYNEVYY